MLIVVLSSFMMVIIVQTVVMKTLNTKVDNRSIITSVVIIISLYALPLIFVPESIVESVIVVGGAIVSIFLPVFIFRGINKRLSIYIALLIQGLIVAVAASVGWIVSIILKDAVDERAVDLFTYSMLMAGCVITARSGALSRFMSGITDIPVSLKVLLISAMWISTVLTGLSSMIFQSYPDLPALAISGVLTAVLILLVVIMCPMLIMNYLSSTHYKNLSDLMNKQVKTQLEHYETMSRMNEDIRKFQHDYKNLRIGLNSYLNQNDVPGALSFLKTEHLLIESSHTFETGNLILDALLDEKQLSVASLNTTIEFEGIVPWGLLDPTDICIIFGNALDNAIEACGKLPKEEKKVIGIKSEYNKDFLFITINNPTAENVKIVNNTVATTKENKISHGIGLRSIRTAVGKYSGVMKLLCVNGIFSVAIDLDFHS